MAFIVKDPDYPVPIIFLDDKPDCLQCTFGRILDKNLKKYECAKTGERVKRKANGQNYGEKCPLLAIGIQRTFTCPMCGFKLR